MLKLRAGDAEGLGEREQKMIYCRTRRMKAGDDVGQGK